MSGAIHQILVPTDGSEGALHAARFAAQLAGAQGAELTLLYVVQATTAETIGLAARPAAEVQASLQAMAEGAFEGAKAAAGGAVAIRELTDIGDPADVIIAQAAALGADLIVMGSRGMGPIQGLLLGSVSEEVVRRAPCPVTVVR